jgi:hypothetical protein
MRLPIDEEAKFAREQLLAGCEVMERQLHGLLDSKGRIAVEVHAIRKLGKSLRGGFALFRLGKSSAKEIQVIGRLLASPRDAVSRLNTWHKLGGNEDAAASAAIGALLVQQTHSAARRPPPETIAWCVARVTAARRNLQELPEQDLTQRVVIGLQKLSTQLAKRFKNIDHSGEEDFHNARKALKAYLGALGFMPPESFTPNPEMTELADVLGDENDLGTLAAWLEARGFTKDFVPGIWEKLTKSRTKLRKKALADAARIISTDESRPES